MRCSACGLFRSKRQAAGPPEKRPPHAESRRGRCACRGAALGHAGVGVRRDADGENPIMGSVRRADVQPDSGAPRVDAVRVAQASRARPRGASRGAFRCAGAC
ncbi:protein of unknown function [Ectopseudomonas oleovorans]|nr:protein of unknown function [Pseudomonas oleovorans]